MQKYINQTEKLSFFFDEKGKAKLILIRILGKINNLHVAISDSLKNGELIIPSNWPKDSYKKELFVYTRREKQVIREVNSRLKRHIETVISKIEKKSQINALEFIEMIIPEPAFLSGNNLKSSIYGLNIFPRKLFKEIEIYFDQSINSNISTLTLKEYENYLNRFVRKISIGFDTLNEFVIRKKTFEGDYERKK